MAHLCEKVTLHLILEASHRRLSDQGERQSQTKERNEDGMKGDKLGLFNKRKCKIKDQSQIMEDLKAQDGLWISS